MNTLLGFNNLNQQLFDVHYFNKGSMHHWRLHSHWWSDLTGNNLSLLFKSSLSLWVSLCPCCMRTFLVLCLFTEPQWTLLVKASVRNAVLRNIHTVHKHRDPTSLTKCKWVWRRVCTNRHSKCSNMFYEN